MDLTRLERQIAFLLELDRLKGVLRRTYVPPLGRRENSAEHSWHLAMAALLLAEHSGERVDPLRALTLALVHDIVEIEAGDSYVYDEAAEADKAARERAAADRLFGMLPEDQAAALRGAWEEFEARESAEARFAAALDRLIPVLHNCSTEGRSWRENGITADRVVARNAAIEAGSPALWALARARIEAAVESGHLAPAPRPDAP